jgi:hypothetical protein
MYNDKHALGGVLAFWERQYHGMDRQSRVSTWGVTGVVTAVAGIVWYGYMFL